jgi:hypothetical protein
VGWLDQYKLAATGLAILYVIVKVIVIAQGDLHTALAILQTASTLTIIVGGIVAAFPLLAAALLATFAYRTAAAFSWQGLLLCVLSLAVCLVLTPWLPLSAALICALAGLTTRFTDGPGRRPVIAFVFTIGLFAIAAWPALYDVWLPHQQVNFKNGGYETGYVLNDDGSWITMLRSGSRELVRYRDDTVTSMPVCNLRESGWKAAFTVPLFDLHDRLSQNKPDTCLPGHTENP